MVGSLRGEISVQLGEGSGEQSHRVMQFPPKILWVLLRSLYVATSEGPPEGQAVRRQSDQKQRPRGQTGPPGSCSVPLGSYLALLSLLTFLNVPPKLCSGNESAHIMGLLRAFIEIMQVKRLAQRLPYCELPIKNTCCPFRGG